MIPEIEAEDSKWRFLGIQAKNRKEWHLSYFGCTTQTVTAIPLYDTLGVNATKYVVDQTELTTVACSIDIVPKLLTLNIENIICFDPVDDKTKEDVEAAGKKIYTFEEVLKAGE